MRPETRARPGRHGLWILGALLLGLAAVAIAGLAGADGEIYSRHSALLPLALALPYRLAGARGVFVVMAGLTALLAWWFLRVSGRDRPDRPGEALLVWALLTFAPPVLLYSHQVWIEIPAALLLLAEGGPASTARFRIRILEMEDPPAVTEGGRLHPRQWAVDRARRSSGIILIVMDRGVLEL